MRPRPLCLALALTGVALLATACGGGSPTAPSSPPAGEGALAFIDSGCACVNPPYPPITIFIDGKKAGTLPVFGKFTIDLTPGQHTWSDDDGDGPTLVSIQDRATVTIDLITNLGCQDGCVDTPALGDLSSAPQSRLHPTGSSRLGRR